MRNAHKHTHTERERERESKREKRIRKCFDVILGSRI